LRKIIFFPLDIGKFILGVDKDLPSKGEIYTGGGDFKASGLKFSQLTTQYCNFPKTGSILDIGSGIGRLAIPLSNYLEPDGSYEGFDVIKKGVEWCKKNISQKHSNFNFTHVGLSNDLYTNAGAPAQHFNFPYKSQSFDCTIAISVYTHLLKNELEQYMRESKRVMKKGAKSLATFFIISNDSEALNNPKFQFRHKEGIQWLMDKSVKHANVAFQKDYLINLIENELDLKIDQVLKGNWNNPENNNSVDFQDIIIYSRK
jgi:ubiquinone/menaquinone biosynthesis C-methylase UbiE